MAHKLTAKQEAFIRAYLKCGNASEAYRQAYDCKDMKPQTVTRSAHELMQHPNISARVAAYQAKANERAGITLADHLTRLGHLSQVAEGLEQISASVKAEELRAKASGIYTERVEHSGSLEPVIVTFSISGPRCRRQVIAASMLSGPGWLPTRPTPFSARRATP